VIVTAVEVEGELLVSPP
jgi:hypothetical protein